MDLRILSVIRMYITLSRRRSGLFVRMHATTCKEFLFYRFEAILIRKPRVYLAVLKKTVPS